jgi:hypothetical protein
MLNGKIKLVILPLFFSGSFFLTCCSNYNNLAYDRCKRLNFVKLLCLKYLYKIVPDLSAKARGVNFVCPQWDPLDFLVRFLLL